MRNSCKTAVDNQNIENDIIFINMKSSKYILIKWNIIENNEDCEKDIKKSYYITNNNNIKKDIGYVPKSGLLEYELTEDTGFSIQVDGKIFKTIKFLKPKIVSVSLKEKTLELNKCEGYTSDAELKSNDVVSLTLQPYGFPDPDPSYSYSYIVEWETINAVTVEIDDRHYNAEDKKTEIISSSKLESITFNAVSELGFYVSETVGK